MDMENPEHTEKDSTRSLQLCQVIDILEYFQRKDSACEAFDIALYEAKHNGVNQDVKTLENILHTILKYGQKECALQLLRIIQDFDADKAVTITTEMGDCELMVMIREFKSKKFAELIVQTEGIYWLHTACKNNFLDLAQEFLLYGANPNGILRGNSPLMVCFSAPMASLLIDHGAEVKFEQRNDNSIITAAHIAAGMNNCHVVDVLLRNGAKIDSSLLCHVFQEAFKSASLSVHKCSLSSLELRTSSLSSSSSNSNSSSIESIDNTFVENNEAPESRVKMCELLLSYGVNPNEDDYLNRSPFQLASENNDVASIEVMVKSGGDISSMTLQASTYISLSTIEYMIGCGLNLNRTLINFLKSDHIKVLQFLLDRGANPNTQNNEEVSALDITLQNRNLKGFCYLLAAGADVDTKREGKSLISLLLRNIDLSKYSDYIVHLLKYGAKLGEREMEYAVHKSLVYRQYAVLSALVHYGGCAPSLSVKYFDDTENFQEICTPLCLALLYRIDDIAHDLLKTSYLKVSDLTLLPKNKYLRYHINDDMIFTSNHGVLKIVNEMSTVPPSLKQLSFTHVSDLVKCQPGRLERVKKLGLPVVLQNALMFSCPDQIIACNALNRVLNRV